MSILYVKLNSEDNTVVSVIQSAKPFDADLVFEQGLICVEGHTVDFLQTAYMFTDELGFAFFARPSLPELVVASGGWAVSDLPEGTVCTITDLSNGELIHAFTATIDENTLEFSLPETGAYQVGFETTGLFVGKTYDLEVGNA